MHNITESIINHYMFIFSSSGRKITSKGQKDLDQIAGQVRKQTQSGPYFRWLMMTNTMLMQSYITVAKLILSIV